MSDTSEVSEERLNDAVQDNICRDFLRGMCERKHCKYKHGHDTKSLNFCHDFQNTSCSRLNCKFIHCYPDEVEHYKLTGEMSNQILAEATRKNQMPGVNPICNAYRRGMCDRSYCKYRHISKEEQDTEIASLIRKNMLRNNDKDNNMIILDDGTPSTGYVGGVYGNKRQMQFEEIDELGPGYRKRRILSTGIEHSDNFHGDVRRGTFKGYCPGNPPSVLTRTMILEDENNLLQKEIAQLKKQVSDLTATNEFLLDQNANLRINSKRNAGVNMPAVTITNTIPQNNQGQVIRTVAASVATVPVSLATVTTCNPVSGNPVSIAGCPTVSISPATQILAPSQQILVTTNQPTQLAIGSNSQAQLAIAQQNLANNLAQQAQPQLTSQAQQLALATTTQQLTSQAQHMALATSTHPQAQQLANQAQQQINQQLTSQAQQLALANTTQQLTSQAQQLALANTPQQLAVASVPQQLALATASQQLLAQQNSQIELHCSSQLAAINTSQAIAMSNASAPMVSYPIMTHAMPH